MLTTKGIFGRLARQMIPLALSLAAAFASQGLVAQTDLLPDAPIEHFRVFGFDKLNGWRTWQIEGSRAEFDKDGTVQVSDMRLRIYEASKAQTINMLIESPIARMTKTHEAIEGPGTIILTAKGIFLGGENWLWNPDKKTLLIRERTHAVIDGGFGSILE